MEKIVSKNKTIGIVLLLLVIAGIIAFACLKADGAVALPQNENKEVFDRGTSERFDNISVLNLYGTWYDMGKQFGSLAKTQLKDVLDFCNVIIGAQVGNADRADTIVETQAVQMPYTIKEFFRGAAETSGLSEEELQVINAVERIAGLPQCSFAAAWGEYAKDQMVVGRNYDYGEIFNILEDDVVVTVFHPSDGSLSTAIVGYAGEIYAVNGMNEAGFFMELNNGKASAPMSSPDARITGTTLLLDVMFEADSFEFLDRYFNTMLCSSSYIINMADGKEVRSYEWCPVGVKHGEDYNEDGLLVSTNHYNNPDWDLEKPTDETSWMSLSRRDNLIDLCTANKGNIDEDIMKNIITTDLTDGGAVTELTVYQIVAEPGSRMLWVKTIDSQQWVEINLNQYWDD